MLYCNINSSSLSNPAPLWGDSTHVVVDIYLEGVLVEAHSFLVAVFCLFPWGLTLVASSPLPPKITLYQNKLVHGPLRILARIVLECIYWVGWIIGKRNTVFVTYCLNASQNVSVYSSSIGRKNSCQVLTTINFSNMSIFGHSIKCKRYLIVVMSSPAISNELVHIFMCPSDIRT